MKSTLTPEPMGTTLITPNRKHNNHVLAKLAQPVAPRLRPINGPLEPHMILRDGERYWKVVPPESGQSPTMVLLVESDREGRPGLAHSLLSRYQISSPQWMVVREPAGLWHWLTEDRGVYCIGGRTVVRNLTRLEWVKVCASGALAVGLIGWLVSKYL